MRDIAGVPIAPRRVFFRHAAPSDTNEHERFFGCSVQFAAAFDGLSLSTETLESHMKLADDALSAFLVSQLDALAAQSRQRRPPPSKEPGVREEVSAAISRMLPGGVPKLEAIATALAVTPRTLQRRLAAAETSIAKLVDETRYDLARELLQSTERSVAEISFVLGFSEPSAFHRAFKRWSGQTPARFRQG